MCVDKAKTQQSSYFGGYLQVIVPYSTLEICRAYQIIPNGLFISKKPCIGKPSDRFLDSWEKELENTGVNLREVLIEEYVRKLFQLISQFKSTINR